MKNIKISEEQDRAIREMISEDVNEMLNPNANAANSTGVGVTLTKPDGTGFKSAAEAISANSKMDKLKGALPTGSKVSSKFSANGDDYELTSTDKKNGNIYESYLISKKQLKHMQLRKLKENSTVIRKKDFIE